MDDDSMDDVLEVGLSYVVTAEIIPVEEFIVATDQK